MFNRLLRKIHLGIYVFWVVIFFVLFYPGLWLASKNPDKYFSLLVKLRKIVAQLSTWCSGFYFKFSGAEHIDWNKSYIICANHTSLLDISALAILWKRDVSFMGKVELLKNPITSIFFKTIDIPVDRVSKLSSYRAFKMAQKRIEEGRSVIIFPEGGIEGGYPPQLQPFKNGPFRLAIENNVPILPVVIHDLWHLLWDEGRGGSRPGFCSIEVLSPIETKSLGINDTDALREHVFLLFNHQLNTPSV